MPFNNVEGQIVQVNLPSMVKKSDYIITPVIDNVTEKFNLKSQIAEMCEKYTLYAGETPYTDKPVQNTAPTITAKGGFEGKNVNIKLYNSDGNVINTSKIKTKKVGINKVGKLEKI